MTQTVQPRSWALLSEAGKDLTLDKSETEDNRELLLQVFDSMNNLYEKLSRLDYVVKRKKMEMQIYRESEGEKSED
ncbi:MAG: hypothetical protein LBU85_12890 [Treponema sp.]|jgi:hypothetical protein|nr:hypothetical protein [Treponema sp.]